MEDVAEIAGKLTQKERVILPLFRNDCWHDAYYWRSDAVWNVGTVATSLTRKGLADRRNGACSPSEYRISPLGLAVRAHLEKQS